MRSPQSGEAADNPSNPKAPISLFSQTGDSDTRNLDPFRQVVFEQLSRSGFNKAAPTLLEIPEKPQNPEEEHLQPVPKIPNRRRERLEKPPTSRAEPAPRMSQALPITVPAGASTLLQIHAQTVNVYTVGPAECQNCKNAEVTSCSFLDTQPPAVGSSNNLTAPTQPLQQRPPWEAFRPPAHPDIPVDERYQSTSSPHGYFSAPDCQTAALDCTLNDFPLADTAPPEFLDKEHLDAMHEATSQGHRRSNSDGTDGDKKGSSAVVSGNASSYDEEDSFLLNADPTVCPQGKEDCTCAPQYIELFKNAATYLYKHTRSLSQELFQAHVHVGERIERLHQDNALNGGPTLPGSVHEFLQTETSQLLQDWAIAESKCSQYICDSILADVNEHEVAEASEGAAKGIPPDIVDPYGSENPEDASDGSHEYGEGSSIGSPQAQCAEQFALLRKDLMSLTERSTRIKRQWANLLDLCNKLDGVVHASEGVDRDGANAWWLPAPVKESEDV